MKQAPPSSQNRSSRGSNSPTPGTGKSSRPRRRAKGVIGLTVFAALALAVGIAVSKISNISAPGKGIGSTVDSLINPRNKFPGKDRVNIVLIGKDYNRLESKDPKLNGMPFTKGSRADSIVMISLDLNSSKVSALSIPRDTLIQREDGEGSGKINGTYARGGAKQLGKTLGELLGVTPDYYVSLKSDGVKIWSINWAASMSWLSTT